MYENSQNDPHSPSQQPYPQSHRNEQPNQGYQQPQRYEQQSRGYQQPQQGGQQHGHGQQQGYQQEQGHYQQNPPGNQTDPQQMGQQSHQTRHPQQPEQQPQQMGQRPQPMNHQGGQLNQGGQMNRGGQMNQPPQQGTRQQHQQPPQMQPPQETQPQQRPQMQPVTIEDLVQTDVATANPDTPVSSVVSEMAERDVGSVVIVEEGTPIGIITDRTIALSLNETPDITEQPVEQFASEDLVTTTTDTTIFDAIRTLEDVGVRRLPVVDEDDQLHGIVSLDDIIVLLGTELNNATGIIKKQTPRF